MRARLPRRRLLTGAAALAGATALPPPGRAQARGIHALMLGINAYTPTRALRGCLNDVRVVSEALRALGARVTVLPEAEGNRAAFLAAWQRVAAAAAPGDTLVFHFAGHGARAPRADGQPGSAGDFLLFRTYHPLSAPGELLYAAELRRMLAELAGRGVRPIVLLDCCHAGAMTRSGADLTFRSPLFDFAAIAGAEARLPPRPPPPPEAALAGVVFYTAATESELVPEVTAPDGSRHGAFSLGVASALRGAADVNQDGVLTRAELLSHIQVSIRSLAAARQHPDIWPREGLGLALLPSPQRSRPSAAPVARATRPGLVRVSFANLPPTEVAALLRAMPGTEAASADDWDLRWDAASGEAWGISRDRLTPHAPRAALPGIVQRIRAERRLGELALASPMDIRLDWPAARSVAEHDMAHPEGRRLNLRLRQRLPYLVMFNLAGDGRVQPLEPAARTDQRPAEPRTAERLLGFCVRPPPGADLAVAVATARPVPAFIETMWGLAERPVAATLMAALEVALTGQEWQLGVTTIVTRENMGEARSQECRTR